MGNAVPYSVSDILMHGKDSDRTERVYLPFTRYANILSAPSIVTDNIEVEGAPYHFLTTGTVLLTDAEIRKLCGEII